MSDNVSEASARIKKAILTNIDYLCEKSTNLNKILISLLSGGVIDLDLWDEMTNETKYPQTSVRYQKLYTLVLKKIDNKTTLQILLQALTRSGNEHIITKLDLEAAVYGSHGQEKETKGNDTTSGSVALNNAAIAVAETQKKAIMKSLDLISENSTNLSSMLVILQGNEVLSRSECEKIKAEKSKYDSFKMMYNLVTDNLSRKGTYEALVKALHKGLNQHIIDNIEASMQ